MKDALTMEHAAVGYDGRVLIGEICLQAEPGRIVTLIGPNGGGKSTILKSIIGRLPLLGGYVYIGREDMRLMRAEELAKRLSVMLTERVAPEMMTCYEVAAAGRYPYTGRFGRLTLHDREVVDRCLRMVHAAELAQQPFDRISDGQRQRVLLARALCQEPDVLVLDEPTSYLDVRHKVELLSILQKLAKEDGLSIIMSLHEIELAARVADEVVCVQGERIAGIGTPREMMTRERIAALYGLAPGVYDPLSCGVELPACMGKAPQVFVLGGAGKAAWTYRRLQREQIPFATGILTQGDADCGPAQQLAAACFVCGAFEEPEQPLIEAAEQCLIRCEKVIDPGIPLKAGNAYQRRLIQAARRMGIPIEEERG